MSASRPAFRFGATVVKRFGDVRGDERDRLLSPATTMREILDARDASAILRLADELRGGFGRFIAPTRRDAVLAKESIERALLRRELVGLRRVERVSGGGSTGGGAIPESPRVEIAATPVYLPPAETTSTWFEVTVMDEHARPLGSLDLSFSISGRSTRIRTDSRGVARVGDVEGSVAFVSLVDWRGVRDKLVALPSAGVAADVPDAVSYEVTAELKAIQLYSELPMIVVLLARDEQWIGIELVDSHDRPLAGAEYRVTPSRGSVISGRLDALGRARIAVANGGPYTVTFPAFDTSVTSAGARTETPS